MFVNFSKVSIRTKITIGPVLLILFLSVFIYSYYPVKQKEETIKAIESKIESIIDLISIGVGIGMGESDLVAISEAVKWAQKDSSVTYILIIDEEGTGLAKYNPNNLSLDQEKLMSSDKVFEDERILHYKRKIVYQDLSLGYILLGYSLHSMDKAITSLKTTTFYICLIIFLTGFALSILISSGITNPIMKLDHAVKEITSGNQDVKVEVNSKDEIGELAEAFNQMLDNLNKSRDELMNSKQYTENIIMSMLDALFVLDENYTILSVNTASCNELGFTSDEITGKPVDFIFADQRDAVEIKSVLKSLSEIKNKEVVLKTKSGMSIIVLFSASVIYDKYGNPQGIVCVAQDITEIKEAEQKLKDYSCKLEKINQELDQFAYAVSHDLKAPLRAIFKLSEWIQEDLGLTMTPETHKNMQLLRGRVFRLESLINGILEYSKIGKTTIVAENVNLQAMLSDIVDLLEPPENFKIIIAPDLPVIFTQRIRLQQILMNLIANAIKYNDKETGLIKVGFTELNNYFEFCIEDNGPGIEPQYRDKVFGLFQTLQAKDKVESTGIGLTIIKKIIDDAGGKIWIESGEQAGVKFMFTWPKFNK